jgi:hypothetical protein
MLPAKMGGCWELTCKMDSPAQSNHSAVAKDSLYEAADYLQKSLRKCWIRLE